jgi:hypothetical protein
MIGTNALRHHFHPNIWVNALFADYKPTGEFNTIHDATIYPNWIITDVRFPNELKACQDRGAITIRINSERSPASEHESETALDDAFFDYVITNDGTLEQLVFSVSSILKKEKII